MAKTAGKRRLKIALSTGGGDAPGLNAVIRAATKTAWCLGWEVWGIQEGFEGLIDPRRKLVRIDPKQNVLLVRGAVPGPTGGMLIVRETNKV